MMSSEFVLQCVLLMNFGGQPAYDLKTDHCMAMKTDSSVATFNRAYNTANASLDEIITVKNFFGSTRYKWSVPATDTGTIDLLAQAGIPLKDSFPGMAIDLQNLKPANHKEGITIHQINDPSMLDVWVSIIRQSFNYPKIEVERFLKYCAEKKLTNSIKFYIGYFNQAPASACFVVEHGDAISFHFVGTLKEWRGKGLGHALVHKALTDAKERNFKQAFLISSELGKKVYRSLGFEEQVTYRFFGNY